MSIGQKLAGFLLVSSAMTVPSVVFAQGTGGQPGTGAEGVIDPDAEPNPQTIESAEGIDNTPEEDQFEDPEISIPGGTIVVTGRRNRDIARSSSQVVSVLSSEQIARTGEGDIAGALARVTGLSVQGNGFVFVRGLGDRYSLALLNGLPLPSPQPLSRVVPLDIFPTGVISSSLVQKTYSANFPGEFGGGVINLTTQAIPDESFIRFSTGISGDSETTLERGNAYYGGDIDFLGFDDGTRNLPPTLQNFFDSGARLTDLSVDQQAIARELGDPNLVLAQRLNNLPFNFSGGITAGHGVDFGDTGRLGVIANASISNKWRNRSIISQTAVDQSLSLDTDFRDLVTDNRILVNGLLGFGLETGDHKFRFTNLFIRDTLKQTQLSVGTDFQDDDSEFNQDTGWFERQLYNTQLVGELEFGDLSVDLRGGFAQTKRDAPYEYRFDYVRTNNANDPLGDTFINVLDRQTGTASVTFSELEENLYYGGVDVSYQFADWIGATVGYAYTDTSRFSSRREFLFDAGTNFIDAVGALRPDLLLGDAVIDFFDIGLIETTQSDPAFQADLEIHAGYGQFRLSPFDTVSLDIGVRYEDARQSVVPVEVFAIPLGSTNSTLLNNDYFLPGATLTWEISPELQGRISGSRTIARPQFRELVFQTYFDPETNRQFNGNPALIDSELTNYEARLEYYSGQNKVSLAGFYKDIENPIEAFSSFSDNEQLTRFANAPSATLYGGELEAQFNFDLIDWGGFWESKRIVAVANYTFTQSEIQVQADDLVTVFPSGPQPSTNFFIDGVPLTGQSDHLVNMQLGLEDLDKLSQLTLLLSYASQRVTSRGTSNLPDIIEDPGLRLDFVARQAVDLGGRPFELKLEARNITGRDNFEFQTNGTNRIEINTYDVGRSFSFSVSTEF